MTTSALLADFCLQNEGSRPKMHIIHQFIISMHDYIMPGREFQSIRAFILRLFSLKREKRTAPGDEPPALCVGEE